MIRAVPAGLALMTAREIELKFELPPEALAALTRSSLLQDMQPLDKGWRLLSSVYYDTPAQKLRRQGLALRVRRIGRRRIQTVKAETRRAAVMDRAEWESDLRGSTPDLSAAARQSGEKILASRKLAEKLQPLFETRMRRKRFRHLTSDCEIEVSLDKGEVVSEGKTAPLCELELELKRGTPADLFALARALSAQFPLRLSVVSKSERGYALIDGEKVGATGAVPVAIDPQTPCEDAFRIIARACLYQIAANQAPVLRNDPEGVHQARVGLRRLRAAMSLFSGMLANPQARGIRRELRALARALAPAREIDVFIAQVVRPAAKDKSQPPGAAPLAQDLRRKRNEAYAQARAAFSSERFRMLLLDIAAFIETGDWTHSADELVRALRRQPIAPAAAIEMERRRRKIVRKGAKLSRRSPSERHAIRIQAKKLRYAADFFGGSFPGKKAAQRRKALTGALAKLQDSLGTLNDISVHAHFTEQLAAAGGKRKPPAASKAFAAGRLSGREEARAAHVLKEAEKAYKRFVKARPFWR